ncbi:NAD-dependent DNA ligase [Cereibacter johrii]|uniref:NAD-dependent DNA ligase n=1 Tax=Cereibacter johrii TaxID=445629 RepID=UPI000DCAF5A5|nr:NAD-dependent DNA ligase [Cereibacter johrii]RAZ83827.1 NAD-dependent DNA ligase [Cereibacter johrii]
MSDAAWAGRYSGDRIVEKQTHELIGIARGLLADGHLSDPEIEFIHRWLVASEAATANPLLGVLIKRIQAAAVDGVIDDDERADISSTMQALTANEFELGEVLRATSLPLCDPPPRIEFNGARMCFTGTFTFGKRSECEAVATARGATCGNLTQRTRYLVIGEYATEGWKHSSFGNKIIQAIEWRDAGVPISIVSEQHWRQHLA